MDLGQRVRKLRKQQEKSQNDLAVQAGITSSHVAQIENGRIKNPRADLLARLARALGVGMDELFGERKAS
jgi:transcriptional regulator with XRE-family HTH domain